MLADTFATRTSALRIFCCCAIAGAALYPPLCFAALPLLSHVNAMSGTSALGATYYYKNQKLTIEEAFDSSSDEPARERFLWEMSMRYKSLADEPSSSQSLRQAFSVGTKSFLCRYIDWFSSLSDESLHSLRDSGVLNSPPEARYGRVQSVTEHLTSILYHEGDWAGIDELANGLPSVFYLNKRGMDRWKGALLARTEINVDTRKQLLTSYWEAFIGWVEKFPLREDHRQNYRTQALASLHRLQNSS